MTDVVGRGNAEHYPWGEGCEGWRHLSGQDLSVIQERVPSGASEIRHFHHRARQLFFVLEGSLSIELEGVERLLAPRESLEIPPGAVHRVVNSGNQDAWFLVVSSPSTRGDRVEA